MQVSGSRTAQPKSATISPLRGTQQPRMHNDIQRPTLITRREADVIRLFDRLVLLRRGHVSGAAELSDHWNQTCQADGARKNDDPAGEPVAAGKDDDPKYKAGSEGHGDDRGSPGVVVELVVVGHDC